MPQYSSNGSQSKRSPIDDSETVRERVLGVIEHNTGGPHPSAAQEPVIIEIATQADLDPATVRTVLDDLAADGVIECHTTPPSEGRVALA